MNNINTSAPKTTAAFIFPKIVSVRGAENFRFPTADELAAFPKVGKVTIHVR